MGTRDPRIDAYIEKSADFAKPILRYLRRTVHEACPEVQEDWKWSSPSFTYHGLLCGMAAFKQHCTFGFWKGALVTGGPCDESAMGQFGRITELSELPPKPKLVAFIKKAAKLNADGVKVPRSKGIPKPPIPIPAGLKRALEGNAAARASFEHFSPSQKREYLEWLTEAKTEETRQRRLATAIEWMADGKPRNWKYLK